MAASNLKQVVCSTEETEKDPGGLAQILTKAPHTLEAVGCKNKGREIQTGTQIFSQGY